MDEKRNKVEIHIVLEGGGLSTAERLVRMISSRPPASPSAPEFATEKPTTLGEADGGLCPECGFVPIFNEDGTINKGLSHSTHCSYYEEPKVTEE